MLQTDLQLLSRDIDGAMLRDQHRARALVRSIEHAQKHARPFDRMVDRLSRMLEASRARRAWREQNRPRPAYPQELPVVTRKNDIAAAIRQNQVVVVSGETGSGKTTQIPKICLELGRGVAGMIGHTQPRRIAARSVANRIAQELQTSVGHAVGYKIRFGDFVSDRTFIKLMTDGILLAETQGDRFLSDYDTIIIDEAHERSLNIDFLLGYLKQLLPKRPDLKLIITSATIETQRFSRHFGDAPVIEVSGRTYPVEVRYRPLKSEDPDEEDVEQIDGILRAIDDLSDASGARADAGTERSQVLDPAHQRRHLNGDVLVFLAGEREIRETAESLRKHHPDETEILPLYARLSGEDQMKIFQPHGRRRIVLATNVAETSLTVPGIRYVVDPGTARISRYSPRNQVQRLPIEPISQASAEQRKGRCGRVADGICIRLYSEEDFAKRAEFTEPEILRTNLASVILQMKSLRLGTPEEFPFIEPPEPRQIRDGYATLHELGAVDERNELTPIGNALAKLPLDPRIGRMILEAVEENVLDDVLVIAAALTVQDPRERPLDQHDAADQAHAKFRDETSDFLTSLNLWHFYHKSAAHLSHSKLRKLCRENFLSYMRMREWHDVHQQLRELVLEMGLDRRSILPPRKEANTKHRVKHAPRQRDAAHP